jgi:hypothetical protein
MCLEADLRNSCGGDNIWRTFFQGAWIIHWSCVAIDCVGCLFAHEDILICSTIILGVLLVFSIFLSGEFVCVKLFFKPDCFGRKKNL